MEEKICDARWEGPFPWAERLKWILPNHVLYALYGTHHLYGQNQLLYIGRTEVELGTRLAGHNSWVRGEYDEMLLRVASIGTFPSVVAWWKAWDEKARYERADADLVHQVEALLIYALQPSYNSASKSELGSSRGMLRVFNTGKCGPVLPEVSHAYFEE